MITIYHNPRCGKSREGLAILESKNMPFEVRLYLEQPLDQEELENIVGLLDMPAQKLIRTNESIYKEHFKGKDLSREDAVRAMLQYPKLMERPIVVNGDKAVVGRPPEQIHSIF